jgi:hypothetical protein
MLIPTLSKGRLLIGVVALALIAFAIYALQLDPKGPPDFEKKVAEAHAEQQKIQIGPVLKHETNYLTNRKGGKIVCDVGLGCLKGYTNYVGLNEFSSDSLDTLQQKMLGLGWQLSMSGSGDTFEAQKAYVLTHYDRPYGFSYMDKDGLYAGVYFSRIHPGWNNCAIYPICEVASSKQANAFKAIASVEVHYQTDPAK